MSSQPRREPEDDTAAEDAQSDVNKVLQLIAERKAGELVAIMSTEEGRAVIWEILSDCGVYRNPWVQDSDATAFNAGMMNVGQKLFARLEENCPALYLTMRKEAGQRAQKDRHEIAAAQPPPERPDD